MAIARDNHVQQRYNHESHANAKPSSGGVSQQTGHHQWTHQRPFLGTRSSYAVEIIEHILNLYAGANTFNLGVPAGKVGSSKAKKPFTSPYCAYHRFYGHMTEDCRDIQALVEQKT
ncbi:hypothetical protein Fot_32563 [Forsythia ovata]|uniref:Uncharacterized protein n=1 Tax=Forsythia ovata TaxID=205694 RepID=A0ABD1T8E0_9LAMI